MITDMSGPIRDLTMIVTQTRDLAMSAVAIRDIEPGQEITISYIPLGMPTIHRKQALGNWGFNCTCDLCTAPPETREISDERRERLVEIYYAMQDETTNYDTLVELSRELVQLARDERLLARAPEYYQSLMRIFYSFGDQETAWKYGRMSLKLAEILSDPEGEFVSGIRRDLDGIDGFFREG
ncbi:hypothetical protein VTJ49DRAFT_1866 [Mycothermus thermophilus]|uniref:SET domain-containing protein n=1 Tax=Humicola insolens TaxID=85995 RepID=A0ABR3VBK0_HUMIN